jgi:hypothetical protein
MHSVPKDLYLSKVIGELTTQICVGQFDLHFTFGKNIFVVESQVDLVQNGEEIGSWNQGRWPDPQFYKIINVNVVKCQVPNDRLIVISFDRKQTFET